MQSVIGTVLAACVLLGLPIALFLEARRKRLAIGTRPYTWGYFLGACGLIIAALFLLSAVIVVTLGLGDGDDEYRILAFGVTPLCVMYGVPGWYVIKRKRWAWVVLNYLTLNPVFWIIAFIYGKNRWNEFSTPARDGVPVPAPGIS